MPELTHWTNRRLSQLKRDMEHLYDALRRDMGMPAAGPSPLVRLEESESALLLLIQAPGYAPEELSICLEDEVLHLSGARRAEADQASGGAVRRSESFSHQVRLPCPVLSDQASAVFKDGALRITLPKRPPKGRISVCVKVE